MGKTILTILFIILLFVTPISCAASPTNPNLATPRATIEPSQTLNNIVTSAPSVQVTTSPSLTQKTTPTKQAFQPPNLKPGQYVLYQIDKNNMVNLSALSPYTGKTYPLYDASYLAEFELSPSLNRLAIVNLEQVDLIDLETGINKAIEFKNVCSSAAWSPDGSKLALTCEDVFVVNFPDLNVIQLTKSSSAFDGVAWSPDGNWLAYVNVADPYGKDPRDGIYITNTACLLALNKCEEQTKFFYGLFYQFIDATWSLDSSQLVFLALGNIFGIETESMKINLSIELQHENFYDITGFALSPDESQFAVSNAFTQKISLISSKNGKEIASFPIAGTVVSWAKISWPFASGSVYQITALGDNLNLREMPTTNSKVFTKLKHGDQITILEGPIAANGYTWWKIKTDNAAEGWIVDIPDWYQPVNK